MTKKKAKPDPLEDPLDALLTFVANEMSLLSLHDDAATARFFALREAWFCAGCPGTKKYVPKPAPPTVRVRIAVAFKGEEWSARGWSCRITTTRLNDSDMAASARTSMRDFEGPEALHFVEADLPAPPEPKTWEGEVCE